MRCTCPGCGTPCKIAERLQGKKVRCPRCKQVFTADAAAASAEEPVLNLADPPPEDRHREALGGLIGAPADSPDTPARNRPLIPPPKHAPTGPASRRKRIPSFTRRELTTALILMGLAILTPIVGTVVWLFISPLLSKVTPPPPSAAIPIRKGPTNETELTLLLKDLESTDAAARTWACQRLAGAEPGTPRRSLVATALAERLADGNRDTQDAAAKALALWATSEQVPALLGALDHESPAVRQSALQALGNLKDERTIKPVARRLLVGDRQHASKALQAMGPMAEKEVLLYLEDKDAGVRAEACRVLKRIGTAESVAPLEALKTKDKVRDVQVAAADALEEIAKRR